MDGPICPGGASEIRVLVGCEEFGEVRDAFLALGFDAKSCDLRPDARGSNHHIRGDIREVMHWGWDVIVVMHPPCTRLCRSGGHWLYGAGGRVHPKKLPRGRTWESMIAEFEEGCDLFQACLDAPVPLVAVENPVMHVHAQRRLRNLPTPQIVQPWWFGDPAFKATGLYLRGLPPLTATDRLSPPVKGSDEYKGWSFIHRMPPGPDRDRLRSRTFPGIATAIADQWGRVAIERMAA